MKHNHRFSDGTVCDGEMVPWISPTKVVQNKAHKGGLYRDDQPAHAIVVIQEPEEMVRCDKCDMALVPLRSWA